MSTEALMQFYDRAMADPALKAEATKALADGPDAVVAMGSREGYEFTADEFEAQLALMCRDQELSDEDLDAVSGGEKMCLTASA